jgi:hypothetical protein
MSKDNVTPITKRQSDVTLASVRTAIDSWRQAKKRSNEKMPDYLWDQVLLLLKCEPGSDSRILAALRINRPQLEAEKQRRQSIVSLAGKETSDSVEELDFCEVKTVQEPSYPLAYKPAEAFTTTTSVVELYRKDGALMKIHICTERFDELLRAFFNGCE